MKRLLNKNAIWLILLIVMGFSQISGQCNPDSLENIVIEGMVEVDTSGNKIHYNIDIDMDLLADYTLNFGPHWYEPINSEATRPQDGDVILIEGGLKESSLGVIPVIIVYSIDDLFWRNPYENFWNQYAENYTTDHFVTEEGMMILELPDSIIMTSVTGVAMLDTTVMHINYYLDSDGDSIVDYKLNFGPPWYEPEGDIDLPEEGDTVTIYGGIIHVQVYPVLIVIEINEEIWRDANLVGNGGGEGKKGGKWISINEDTSHIISNFHDKSSGMTIPRNWHRGNMPNKLFFQFLQVYPQYLFRFQHEFQNSFAGFEIGCFNQSGENYMHKNQYRMKMNDAVRLQFHYTWRQLEMHRIKNAERIRLHYWNQEMNQWQEANGAIVDEENQMVELYTDELFTYWILTAELNTTKVIETDKELPEINIYPNPANKTSFNLSMNIGNHILTHISVWDVSGICIYRENLGHIGGEVYKSINTNNWKQGIYFVGIYLDGKLSSRRLIILDE